MYSCVARRLHQPAKCSNVCDIHLCIISYMGALGLVVMCFNDFLYIVNTARVYTRQTGEEVCLLSGCHKLRGWTSIPEIPQVHRCGL